MANDLVKKIRREMTDTERILSSELRHRRLGANRFRRQHAIGPYVADLVSIERRFVGEIYLWPSLARTRRSEQMLRRERILTPT